MTEKHITMSHQEIDRVGVIKQVVDKRLKQQAAAEQLGLSVRQIKRLVQRYRTEGAGGLVSRHRGKRPSNAIATTVANAFLPTFMIDYNQHFAVEPQNL